MKFTDIVKSKSGVTWTPPPGYIPVPGSTKRGYYKLIGGKRDYVYPPKGAKIVPRKSGQTDLFAQPAKSTQTPKGTMHDAFVVTAKLIEQFQGDREAVMRAIGEGSLRGKRSFLTPDGKRQVDVGDVMTLLGSFRPDTGTAEPTPVVQERGEALVALVESRRLGSLRRTIGQLDPPKEGEPSMSVELLRNREARQKEIRAELEALETAIAERRKPETLDDLDDNAQVTRTKLREAIRKPRLAVLEAREKGALLADDFWPRFVETAKAKDELGKFSTMYGEGMAVQLDRESSPPGWERFAQEGYPIPEMTDPLREDPKPVDRGKPQEGKVYSLLGISQGKTWAESEAPREQVYPETAPVEPKPKRPEPDPYIRTQGVKYESGMDTADAAKRIRQDIKAAIKAGDIPKGVKVSVRIDRYSMGSSVDVRIKAAPFPILNREHLQWAKDNPHEPYAPAGVERFTEPANKLLDQLKSIAGAYHRSESEPYTDYYNTNFHLTVEPDWELRSEERKAFEAGTLPPDPGEKKELPVEEPPPVAAGDTSQTAAPAPPTDDEAEASVDDGPATELRGILTAIREGHDIAVPTLVVLLKQTEDVELLQELRKALVDRVGEPTKKEASEPKVAQERVEEPDPEDAPPPKERVEQATKGRGWTLRQVVAFLDRRIVAVRARIALDKHVDKPRKDGKTPAQHAVRIANLDATAEERVAALRKYRAVYRMMGGRQALSVIDPLLDKLRGEAREERRKTPTPTGHEDVVPPSVAVATAAPTSSSSSSPSAPGWDRMPEGGETHDETTTGATTHAEAHEHTQTQGEELGDHVESPQEGPQPSAPGTRPDPVTEGERRRQAVEDAIETMTASDLEKAARDQKRTKGERRAANEAALRIVKQGVDRGGSLSDEERETLAGYTGEGGIGASLNQYFTRADIAKAMWDKLIELGLPHKARVLEPACGTGVFLQEKPQGLVGGLDLPKNATQPEWKVAVEGVELDENNADIAQALFGQKTVFKGSFEEWAQQREGLPQEHDAVITNAPFITRDSAGLKLHKPGMANADQYFLDTALDRVKEGGTVQMIVHRSVLSEASSFFRKRLLARAEVVGAYRLPESSFEHAHTTVTSDVVILRKRPQRVADTFLRDESTMKAAGVWDEDFVSGQFFEKNPEAVFGTPLTAEETGWRATVKGDADKVADQLRNADLYRGLGAQSVSVEELEELAVRNDDVRDAFEYAKGKPAEGGIPELGTFRTEGNKTYVLLGKPPRWRHVEDVNDVQALFSTSEDGLREAYQLAQEVERLLALQKAGEFYKARYMRRLLAERVQAWVDDNGIPAEHKTVAELAKNIPGFYALVGAVQHDGTLSDALRKDPVPKASKDEVPKMGSLQDAAEYLAERNNGFVPLAELRPLWPQTEALSDDELRSKVLSTGMFAMEASGDLVHLEDYLTGNLYAKLEGEERRLSRAGDDAKALLEPQVERLRKRIAERRKLLDDINVEFRSRWLPPEVLSAFLTSEEGYTAFYGGHFYTPGITKVEVVEEDGIYGLRRTNAHTPAQKRGEEPPYVSPVDFSSDLCKYLNRRGLKRERVAGIKDKEEVFRDWLLASPYRREVEELYNRKFNAEAPRQYSAAPLEIPGLGDEITLHNYQTEGVRWGAEEGKGIMGYDVGLGKTFMAIALAKLLKSRGVNKPTVVVPKSVATNWAEECETLAPGSRILVIGESTKVIKSGPRKGQTVTVTDDAKTRNAKLAGMRQNDYDLVIITRPAFERIPLREETTERFETDKFGYKRKGALDAAYGTSTQDTADKRIKKLSDEWAAKMRGKDFVHEKDRVFFEDLGIDCLFADEAHAYKNLEAIGGGWGGKPAYLGGSGESKIAQNMEHKARIVRETAGGGRGIFFLTATPMKNSPLELYNMLQHIAPEEWTERGINDANDFVQRYCKIEDQLVLSAPKGKKDEDVDPSEFEGKANLVERPCVVGMTGMTEINDLMQRLCRVRTAEDVGLPLPELKEELHLIEMTDEQKHVYDVLREEAAEAREGSDSNSGSMFAVLDLMKKAAQDLELYDPEGYAEAHKRSPKYQACVKNVVEGYHERGGQLVFCDHNASHERIKGMLVEAGIPADEIAIVNSTTAPDSSSRQEISRKFNTGEYKVVIGNTGVMGEGVNLQGKKTPKGATDVHRLDEPWDPGTMHQRRGRIHRQGNPAETVTEHVYLAKASFDGMRHANMRGKKRVLDQIMSGSDEIVNEQSGHGLSDAQLAIALSEDPEAAAEAYAAREAEAEEAWRARRKVDAVIRWHKLAALRERINKLAEKGDEAGELRDREQQETARLLRNESLPDAVRPYVEDRSKHGLVYTGTDAVFVPGQVVEKRKGYGEQNLVVVGVDYRRAKVVTRAFGSSSTTSHDIDDIGKNYAPSDVDPASEVDSAVARAASNREGGYGSYSAFEHVPEEYLAKREDDVRREVEGFLPKKNWLDIPVWKDGKVVVSSVKSVLGAEDVIARQRKSVQYEEDYVERLRGKIAAQERELKRAEADPPWEYKKTKRQVEAVIADTEKSISWAEKRVAQERKKLRELEANPPAEVDNGTVLLPFGADLEKLVGVEDDTEFRSIANAIQSIYGTTVSQRVSAVRRERKRSNP